MIAQSTIFDALPDTLLRGVTQFSHQSLVGVSKAITQRYVQLHVQESRIGDFLVRELTQPLSWRTIEKLRSQSTHVFALTLDFGTRPAKEYPSCSMLECAGALFPRVREVRLRGKHISDNHVEAVLKGFSNLSVLSIKDSDEFSADGSYRMVNYVTRQGNPVRPAALTHLQISGCKNIEMTQLLLVLRRVESLRRLEVTRCAIRDNYERGDPAPHMGDSAAAAVLRYCNQPHVRYLKTSHFHSIDAAFRRLHRWRPNLILEEESVGLLRRSFYKITDPFRPHIPAICTVGVVVLLMAAITTHIALENAQFQALTDGVISKCVAALPSKDTECRAVDTVAKMMRRMIRYDCVVVPAFQEAQWTPLCTTFTSHNSTHSIWQKDRLRNLVQGFFVGTGAPTELPQNPMAVLPRMSFDSASRFCFDKIRFLQYSAPVQQLCKTFTNITRLASEVTALAEEHLWPITDS